MVYECLLHWDLHWTFFINLHQSSLSHNPIWSPKQLPSSFSLPSLIAPQHTHAHFLFLKQTIFRFKSEFSVQAEKRQCGLTSYLLLSAAACTHNKLRVQIGFTVDFKCLWATGGREEGNLLDEISPGNSAGDWSRINKLSEQPDTSKDPRMRDSVSQFQFPQQTGALKGDSFVVVQGLHGWGEEGKQLDLFIGSEYFPIGSPNLSSSIHSLAPNITNLVFMDAEHMLVSTAAHGSLYHTARFYKVLGKSRSSLDPEHHLVFIHMPPREMWPGTNRTRQ